MNPKILEKLRLFENQKNSFTNGRIEGICASISIWLESNFLAGKTNVVATGLTPMSENGIRSVSLLACSHL
jgi:hypothetical protein